ncbi:hypothetical protein ACP4OV_016592 [Aristida adscensionis]
MFTDLLTNCKCLLTHKLSADKQPADTDAIDPCVVLILDLDHAQYWFCHIETDRWWQHHNYRLVTLDAEGRRHKGNMAGGVGIAAVGSKIYYELGEHEMGILEFDPVHFEPPLIRIKVDMVRIPRGFPTWLTYFVESRGELFSVTLYFRLNCQRSFSRIALYKMDFSTSSWCKVESIGDRVFLLCADESGLSRFGASCPASDHGLTCNHIYFFNHASPI